MPVRLQCPTCSAPLELPELHQQAVRCPYCGSGVLLNAAGTAEAAEPGRQADAIAEVVRLLRQGNKIGAIKVYRDTFGVGLKEAKDAVERIEAGQPAGTVPRTAAGSGCGIAFALLGVVVAIGAAILALSAGGGDEPEALVATPTPTATAPARPEKQGPPPFAEQVMAFGSEGTGAGRFTDARSVAVDGQGRIYVAEYSGGRLQVFDSTGTFLTQWIAEADMPFRDLEAERGGTVYVVQSGDIRRYEGPTGKRLPDLRAGGRGSFDDVALALDGTVWATAWPTDLVHLSREGKVLKTINAGEAVPGGSAHPARIAVAGTGDLYVLDQFDGNVYRFDASGRYVDRFGGRGDGDGKLRAPSDLALDGKGRVYVSDMGTIKVFSADGDPVGSFGEGVVFGITFNERDELFGAFRNAHQVRKYRLLR